MYFHDNMVYMNYLQNIVEHNDVKENILLKISYYCV